MAIPFNMMKTTNAAGLFSATSDGVIVGTVFDNASALQFQSTGIVGGSVPMWGGMAVTAAVPAVDDSRGMGVTLTKAANEGAINGFTVFESFNGVISSVSSAPQYEPGQTITWYPIGSGARIVVALDPTIATSVAGGAINQQLAWDETNNRIIAYSSGTALPAKVLNVFQTNVKTVAYASSGDDAGALKYVLTGNAAALIQI